jgi:SAM-dependent methyltransferase
MVESRNTRSSSSRPPSGYFWTHAAKTAMGRYITDLETVFLKRSLARLSRRLSLVIDAGAGDGRFSRVLAQLADRVIATEVNDSLVDALGKISSHILPVLVNPASSRLPAQDNSADCVVCIEVPDLTDHDWFLAECHRVLRPGGILIVTLENRHSWKGILASRARRYATKFGSRYYAYSSREMTARLSCAGFRREEGLGFNWLPFTRASDNPLIPLSAKLEALLQLRRLVSVSPWVILAARKDA